MDLLALGIVMTSLGFHHICGFNLDVSRPIIYTGPEGSRFGYSLAQLSTTSEEWLVVGAPASHRFNKYMSGDVYMCRARAAGSNNCNPMEFHKEGEDLRFHYQDNRTDQWLGATLMTSGKTDGNVMACAPRLWIHDIATENTPVKKGFLIGGCYVLKQDQAGHYTNRYIFDPCVKEDNKRELRDARQRMCQAGFSAAFDSTGENIVMGAPTSLNAQGQLILQTVGKGTPTDQTLHSADPSLLYTYNGFSMASGEFTKDNVQDYVSGSPRMALVGSVNFYEVILNIRIRRSSLELTGEQMGEYFGYCLAVGDFNGDKLDDLAVGAPMYSDYKDNLYETGRVYVYYQSGQTGFDEDKTILEEPMTDQSRFGLAVASAGDLNYDQFDDLLVGAPYGGKDNRGVVFVYYGSISGLRKKVSQTIHGADLDTDVQLFGFSLTGGLDQDNNGYADVAIGAFQSNKAISLKSRPVLKFSLEMKLTTRLVDLEMKTCDKLDRGQPTGQKAACFSIEPCISFRGYKIPDEVEFTTTITLDTGKTINKRAYFGEIANNPFTTTITQPVYQSRGTNCMQVLQVHLKDNLRDKLAAINIKMVSTVKEDSLKRDSFGLKVIQNPFTSNEIVDEVNILKFCGSDDICIPDLVIHARGSSEKLTYGKETSYEVHISVANQGESSYETRIYTEFPKGIDYINVKVDEAVTAVSCTTATNVESVNTVIVCDVGNPLPSNKQAILTIRASVRNIPVMDERLTIKVHVNSSNPENDADTGDNSVQIYIDLAAEVELTLEGASSPKELLYNLSAFSNNPKTLEEVGPPVTHLYQLINNGPSRTLSTKVQILWPSYSEDSSDLLYLVAVPRVLREDKSCCNGYCTSAAVNPRKLNSTIAEPTDRNSRSTREVAETTHEIICVEESHMCTVIECTVNSLAKGGSSLIEITSRVAYDTISRMEGEKMVLLVSSQAATRATQVPYVTKDLTITESRFLIETAISASDVTSRKPVHWWIILVSVLIGLLLLIIFVIVLYKCGFFKRKQVQEDMKRLTVVGRGSDEEGEEDPMNALNQSDDDDGL